MTCEAPDAPLAGWHRHPQHPTVERYWDGVDWTGEHRFVPAQPTDAPSSRAGGGRPLRELLGEDTFHAGYASKQRRWRRTPVARVVALCLIAAALIGGGKVVFAVLIAAPILAGLFERRRWVLVAAGTYGLSFGALCGLLGAAIDQITFFGPSDTDYAQLIAFTMIGAILGTAFTTVCAYLGQWLGSLLDGPA